MNVLVRGLGNIGTTLANLLAERAPALGIDQVRAHSRRELAYLAPDLALLCERGVLVTAGPDTLGPALQGVGYVFDCREPGAPRADRSRYMAPGPRASAQGTEVDFGPPYVLGVNDAVIAGAHRVRVASCNSHALVSLVQGLSGGDLGALESADFVLARRAEDLGSHQGLVSGTVVARHRHPDLGTHHAADAAGVFATLGQAVALTSSAVTTPSQLLHTLRFALRFREPPARERILTAIDAAPLLARTDKFDGNRVFELGRRYGFQGRLYAHAIVVASDLVVRDRDLVGWAFVPQEGNTILSSVAAFLHQTDRPGRGAILDALVTALVRPAW